MRFTSPAWLLLLGLLPVIGWMGWPLAGQARRRGLILLVVRLVIALCLILACAGVEIVRSGRQLAVVFLVDMSDSMSPQAIAAEMEYVRSALKSMGPDDQAAVVVFGSDALVDHPMSGLHELEPVLSVPLTYQTDLAGAIRLGLALFPAGPARRMVVLSDGIQTGGEAQSAARLAAAYDVQIEVLPFVSQTGPEALIAAVDLPGRLRRGQRFDLNVTIQATQPMRSSLRIMAGGRILYDQMYDLQRGVQTLAIPFMAGEPGFTTYQVQISPAQDVFYQNNRLDAFAMIQGPPRVLMVAPSSGEILPDGKARPDEYSALLQALQAAGLEVTLAAPDRFPADLTGLAEYNSVVAVDVPASAFSPVQMQNLQTYVRDLGGGLVMVGGPTSYGVGGYYDTPLESALPLDMQIKDEKRRPSLAMVFIIDHSGSMSETSGGEVKLELAKAAAARSVQLLMPNDRVGVIAFDDSAGWVVPMTDLTDPAAVDYAIGTLRPGGGTDILAGLQAMARVLPADPARVKHVVLLTDGGADPAGIADLVKQLYQTHGITLSVVAVGHDAAPFLEALPPLANGRYHYTADAQSIPSIFTEETTLATRAYLVEEPFFPKLVGDSPIMAGLDSTPRLYGYVAASPKNLAQVILESDRGDPILAAWQYGLGRSVAFTSDATGRWARDWVQDPDFPKFWSQAVGYTLNETRNADLEMTVAPQGRRALLTLDAYGSDGSFLNDYGMQANVISPGGEAEELVLQQVGPGRYQADFQPGEQGVYLIHLSGQPARGQAAAPISQTSGWVLSYSPEYRRLETNPDLLLKLAILTGGRVASAQAGSVFAHDLRSSRSFQPVWPWLLLLAAFLLPVDVGLRRLIITRRDLAFWREWLMERLAFLKPYGVKTQPRQARLQSLLEAKGRARQGLPVPLKTPLPPADQEPAAGAEETPIQPLTAPTAGPSDKQPSLPRTPASTATALLAQKKARKKK